MRTWAPRWTDDPSRFLHEPYFTTPIETLKIELLAQSPLAFRRRMIFTEARTTAARPNAATGVERFEFGKQRVRRNVERAENAFKPPMQSRKPDHLFGHAGLERVFRHIKHKQCQHRMAEEFVGRAWQTSPRRRCAIVLSQAVKDRLES
jgi:hypothetical protein